LQSKTERITLLESEGRRLKDENNKHLLQIQ